MRLGRGILLAVFLLQGIHGLCLKSGTCDELAAHLPAGILHWKSGRSCGGLANPPLGQLLVAAGAVLAGTAEHPLRQDPAHMLPARLPVEILGVVTLLVIAAFGRLLSGPNTALFALGAAALSPNLVAHSRLATLDLPVTAFTALACLAAWQWVRGAGGAALAAYAFALGTAACMKFTALHFLPALALGGALAPAPLRRRLARALALIGAGVAGIVLLSWLSYGGGPARGLLPAAYVEGLLQKSSHARAGHFAYLLGEPRLSGFAHYFLVALAVKVPLPILLSAVLGAVALARGRLPGDRRGFALFVLLPGFWIFAAMSLLHRVDIGLRHVLPAFPGLLALAGAGGARLSERAGASRALAAGLAAWLAFGAARITPDHLAYFNEFAGGPDRGDRILIDSNLDWGQDEGRFRRWAAGREIAVNPPWPCEGLVAANVNALHGILQSDDRRLRWLGVFEPEVIIGHTWRIYRVEEEPLRRAARRDPARALDYARFLLGTGRPVEAHAVLERNDLSRHARLAPEWAQLLTEALLRTGQLREAAQRVQRARDRDLALEVAYRVSEAHGTPWSERDERERRGIFAALVRRGREKEAAALARRLGKSFPEGIFPTLAGASSAALSPGRMLARARLWKELGREERALREVAGLLGRDPGNEEALWLYGELVVRRKLGLAEYPLPEVDWSGLAGG